MLALARLSLALFLFIASSPVLTFPTLSLGASHIDNGIKTDAQGVVPSFRLEQFPLICPFGIQKGSKAKNILFIHGTGGTGDATWKGGMPTSFHHVGYSSCWVNLPNLTLGDAQLTSEYVVHSIKNLYSKSGNSPIFLVGHSQGNLNIQWALNFWPSIRKMVASFMSLSGDFQGTNEGPFIVSIQETLLKGTSASVIQQTVTHGKASSYLLALNKHGNKALVPTTSTYGKEDQVIQRVKKATSLGPHGAPLTHVAVQDICSFKIVDHFLIVINRVAFYLALDAFEHKSAANVKRVKKKYPDLCKGSKAPNMDPNATINAFKQEYSEVMSNMLVGYGTPTGPFSMRVQKEPELVPYAAHQP